MKTDLFIATENGIEVMHDSHIYRLTYKGNLAKTEIRRFCQWANSSAGIAFIHDAHHEVVTGLERRRVHTKKPAQISGYSLTQWVRFIYGHEYSNSWGPLFAKLLVAKYPELSYLIDSKK